MHLFHKLGSCCHFLFNSTTVWYLLESEARPTSDGDGEEINFKDGTETSSKLTKDKIHVEELRLPEIMIPVTKTKGNNTCRNILCIFFLFSISSHPEC